MIVYILLFFLLTFFAIILFYFVSPSLSPIPFYPTNKKDLPLIVKTILSSTANHFVFDLGAGTGTVIFAAALEAYRRQLPTKFFAVEINPFLILVMHLKRFFHPNRRNILVVHRDIFKGSLQLASVEWRKRRYPFRTTWDSPAFGGGGFPLERETRYRAFFPRESRDRICRFDNYTIYLYVGPYVMEKLKPTLLQFPNHTRIVSYMYPIPSFEKRLKKIEKNVNSLYSYRL